MRVAIFVDGSNFYYTQKKLGWKIDLKKILDYCSQWGEITDAYYYNGTEENDSQRAFFGTLVSIGYSIVTKPVKHFNNEDGTHSAKANLDIEIVMDMFSTIDTYDMAVLVSGDSDFERALQMLRTRGKKFKVLSTFQCVAKEIRYLCGMHFIDFVKIRDSVEKTDPPQSYHSREEESEE